MMGAADRRRMIALVAGACSLAAALSIGSPLLAEHAAAETETALRLGLTPASTPIREAQVRVAESYAYLAIVEAPQGIDVGIWVPPSGGSRTPFLSPTPVPEARPPGLSSYLHPIPPVIPIPLSPSHPAPLPGP